MNRLLSKPRHSLAAFVLPLLLAACGGGGGGGGDSGGSPITPTPPIVVVPPVEVLQPSSSFAQRCAPGNPDAPSASKTGSLSIEKQWLRSYFDEAYLWRDEVPVVDAGAAVFSGSDVSAALSNYFDALLSTQRTDSGALRDRFSFIMPTAEWTALADSGIDVGYGIEWQVDVPTATTQRRVRIASVEPGSAAANSGLKRGYELYVVNGVVATTTDKVGRDTLYGALYPSRAGTANDFIFINAGSYTLSAAAIAKNPVPLRQVLTAADGAKVGYLVFNDHNVPSESKLIEAVTHFKAQAVSDLVLDLRYNGGGYLFIASELAYMIAGPTRVGSQVFERLSYNSRRSTETSNTPFYSTSCQLSSNRCTSAQPLPTLNLARVFVLTQSGTCSASESVINGLRGVGVDVIQIGGKTCGKPYGFTARDNCGVSYFPIEFVGSNAKGFGDYSDGFEPVAAALSSGRKLPGCTVDDDFSRALGDSSEAMLAGAMSYRSTGVCPIRTGASASLTKAQAALMGEGAVAMDLRRSPARSNRILGGR